MKSNRRGFFGVMAAGAAVGKLNRKDSFLPIADNSAASIQYVAGHDRRTYVGLIRNGILTVDDVREIEGLRPYDASTD